MVLSEKEKEKKRMPVWSHSSKIKGGGGKNKRGKKKQSKNVSCRTKKGGTKRRTVKGEKLDSMKLGFLCQKDTRNREKRKGKKKKGQTNNRKRTTLFRQAREVEDDESEGVSGEKTRGNNGQKATSLLAPRGNRGLEAGGETKAT